jgi:hypothetical protein
MRARYRDVAVPAISEDSLPRVLRRLELYDDVANGKAACYICGKPELTLETIGAIAMISGKPVSLSGSILAPTHLQQLTCLSLSGMNN